MNRLALTLSLATRSLANRRLTAVLTVLSIAVSVALVVGVEQVRTEAKRGFTNTISGADLIVGARSGQLNLLLYSVFRIGDPTTNVSYANYERIAARDDVAWTIPISLGDSHRGFRVMGTTDAYFEHYRFADNQALTFTSGVPFKWVTDAVIGADVAAALGYATGDPIVVSHGLGATSFQQHTELPFRVAGVLRRTGTPVDRTVHVTLAGIEAIHNGWARTPAARQPVEASIAEQNALQPTSITAFIVGMDSRIAIFGLQRAINEFNGEPLLAIIPGVALQQLWSLVGVAETALFAVSAFVVIGGLIGLLTTLLTSLAERRREMAVLRAVGAGRGLVFALLIVEAWLLAFVAGLIGVGVIHAALWFARPIILDQFGLYLAGGGPGAFDAIVVVVVAVAAAILAAFPAWRAYRYSLADGLTVRT
ncbi:MAG: FtsX-like permease family protein [Pseudomonadota bacterium]